MVFTVEWTEARPPAETGGEESKGLGLMKIPSELGHVAITIYFLA